MKNYSSSEEDTPLRKKYKGNYKRTPSYKNRLAKERKRRQRKRAEDARAARWRQMDAMPPEDAGSPNNPTADPSDLDHAGGLPSQEGGEDEEDQGGTNEGGHFSQGSGEQR